jgi:phenylpyruvate tautomerase PptA (4-oxalocrotonate tautomerase family)
VEIPSSESLRSIHRTRSSNIAFSFPFANFKVPEAALSRAQQEEIVHRVTDMLAKYFSEAARPHTMVLIRRGQGRRLCPRRRILRDP